MTKASVAPRPCSSITTASTGSTIKVARIFNTYGPRMHPNDGRVVSNFIVQALRGEPITLFGDGNQTRSFLLRRPSDRWPGALDGQSPHRLLARLIWATPSNSRCGSLPSLY